MRFIRFAVAETHPDSGVADGVFRTAYALRDSDEVSSSERAILREQLAWFGEHLPVPRRFSRTSSKGFYRRKSKGIAWFRDNALEHIARLRQIQAVLEAHGHGVRMLVEERIGYVVYEDDAQVIAEPFKDTDTGP
jgi:hypothetical protein